MSPGVGPGKEIPVLVKVAKLETSLDVGGATVDLETGNITFDKETDEVVLIYGADIIAQGYNGMGTGSELRALLTRDTDEDELDFDDEDVMVAWHLAKSFVTSGMSLFGPNLLKWFPQPLVTSRPQVRFVASVATAVWSDGKVNCYVYYTTRKLDSEAMRILIGGD